MIRRGVEPTYADLFLVVIVLQKLMQGLRNRQVRNPVVGDDATDDGTAEVLEGKRKGAHERQGQHRLEEHAAGRVLVMLDKATHARRREDVRVVSIEAEPVVVVLDASVQRAAVPPEADREEELLLRAVAQQERPLGTPVEEVLGLVPVHDAPVVGAVDDLLQVGHQVVDEIDLSVNGLRYETTAVPVVGVKAAVDKDVLIRGPARRRGGGTAAGGRGAERRRALISRDAARPGSAGSGIAVQDGKTTRLNGWLRCCRFDVRRTGRPRHLFEDSYMHCSDRQTGAALRSALTRLGNRVQCLLGQVASVQRTIGLKRRHVAKKLLRLLRLTFRSGAQAGNRDRFRLIVSVTDNRFWITGATVRLLLI